MTGMLNRPRILEGLLVAFVAAAAGGSLFAIAGAVPAGGVAMRLVIAVVAFVYVLYLVRRGRLRSGRLTAVAVWLAGALAFALWSPPLVWYVAAHLCLVCTLRCCCFHRSLLAALADLGITTVAFAAGVWALIQTGSFAASLWALFLVQALFVLIPTRAGHGTGLRARETPPEDRFQRAHRAAETALVRLASR